MSEKDENGKKKFSNLSENTSEEGNPPKDIAESEFNPDKLSEEIEGEKYTPITENPVMEREYTQAYAENKEVIPEPTFEIPTFEQAEEKAQNSNSTAKKPDALANPQIEQATSEEKVQGAEILADALLDGYEKLHELAQWYVSIDQEELIEKSMDDKIDLTMEIPADEEGGTVTLQEFATNFNDQSKVALQLDPSFKEKVRAPMIRVFIKRGWGLSDEQYLGYMFGRDIVEKTTIMVGLKRSMSRTMMMLEKQYKKQKDVQANIEREEEPVYHGNKGNQNQQQNTARHNPNEEEVHYTTVEEPEETQFKGESDLKDTVIITPAEETTD